MFDSIGHIRDEEARKRRAKAWGITTCIAFVGFGLGYALTPTVQLALETVEPVERVVCLTCDYDPGEVIEVAPPPPSTGQEGGGEVDQTDEMDQRVVYTVPTNNTIVNSAPTGKGDKIGPGTGQGGKDPGPGCDGENCGDGNGPQTLHHTQLEILDRIQPRYPTEAKRRRMGDERCLAKLKINERGRVYDVQVEDCPSVFHRATQEALMTWTFKPVTTSVGTRVEARTTVGVTFKR